MEVIVRQLMDEISAFDKNRQIFEKSTNEAQRAEAFREALKYGGFIAQHAKEAYGLLKEVQHKPTSVSITLGGTTLTWSLD